MYNKKGNYRLHSVVLMFLLSDYVVIIRNHNFHHKNDTV